MSEKDLKKLGAQGEDLVCAHYENKGYLCKKRNYTIPGGEIDLIFSNESAIIFVEVKVVDYVDDIADYVTDRKLYFLHRSIEQYLQRYSIRQQPRLDVVYVKHGTILEIYEGIDV